jgi:hypothetical protein
VETLRIVLVLNKTGQVKVSSNCPAIVFPEVLTLLWIKA